MALVESLLKESLERVSVLWGDTLLREGGARQEDKEYGR